MQWTRMLATRVNPRCHLQQVPSSQAGPQLSQLYNKGTATPPKGPSSGNKALSCGVPDRKGRSSHCTEGCSIPKCSHDWLTWNAKTGCRSSLALDTWNLLFQQQDSRTLLRCHSYQGDRDGGQPCGPYVGFWVQGIWACPYNTGAAHLTSGPS